MATNYPKITEAVRDRETAGLPADRIRVLTKNAALTELGITVGAAGADEQWAYNHAHVVFKLPAPGPYVGSDLEVEINILTALHWKRIEKDGHTYIILNQTAAEELAQQIKSDARATEEEKQYAEIIARGGAAPIHARTATAAPTPTPAPTPPASATANGNLLQGEAIQKIKALAAKPEHSNWQVVEESRNKVTINIGNSDNQVIVENNIMRMKPTPESYKAAAEIAKELIANSVAAGAKTISGFKLGHRYENVDALAEMANAYLDQGLNIYIDPPHLLEQVKDRVKTEHKVKLQETHDDLRGKLAGAPPSTPMTTAASGSVTPPHTAGGSGPSPRTR